MNRRKFALSWGRKLFFGLSWPLTSILGLLYLKSFILPTTPVDFIYFGLSVIGHYGLLNALVYFLLFCPIVLLMPTYYVARFWSLILILALNLLVLIDALMFGNYLEHTYGIMWKLLLENGLSFLPGAKGIMTALAIGILVMGLLIWLRGERIWRHMQTRFSNPIKNWYLIVIVLCLVISKSIYHYGGVASNMSRVFPLDLNFKRVDVTEPSRKIFYPREKIVCTAKENVNFIVLTVRQWGSADLNPDSMPEVFHMKRHAVSYHSHFSGASYPEGGIFSLMYSIPSVYSDLDASAAFMTELTQRDYEVAQFVSSGNDEETLLKFNDWATDRSDEVIRPFVINLAFSGHPTEADKMIHEVVGKLQKRSLLKNTALVITGGATQSENEHAVPLYIVWPDRRHQEINHVTSHYDVMPTLMENLWGCKDVFKKASIGRPLSDSLREWLLVETKNGFRILDFKNSVTTTIEGATYLDHELNGKKGTPRRELILEALKLRSKFLKGR